MDEPAPTGPRIAPRLLTGHAPRRRPDGGIQFGCDPDAGLVLDGLTHDDVDVLTRIDGRAAGSDLTAHPTRAGVSSPRAVQLLDLLAVAGLVTDPVPITRYRQHRVLVDGTGPLASTLADHLAAIGVGRVAGGPYAVDASDVAGRRTPPPDLVVVLGSAPIAPVRVLPLRVRGIRHLVVAVAESSAVVGPLVVPGHSACLECLELHRTDRDPAWPASTASPAIGTPEPLTCAAPLAGLVTSLAAAVAVADLDRQCPSGVSLEVGLPWPRVLQRQWAAHPRCGCGAARTAASAAGRQWSA